MFASETTAHPQATTRTVPWLPIATLGLAVIAAFSVGVGRALISSPAPAQSQSPAEQTRTAPERRVIIAGKLSNDQLLALGADVTANGGADVLLLDSPAASAYTKTFLDAYHAERIVPVGEFPAGMADLEQRVGAHVEAPLVSPGELFTRAERVVVCPAQPRRILLQAACLAGVLHAPLWITHEERDDAGPLFEKLLAWRTREVFSVGAAVKLVEKSAVAHVALPDEQAVAARYLRHLRKQGPVETIVVTNPGDVAHDLGGVSALAPWLALQHRAMLVCTNEAGDNTAGAVGVAITSHGLKHIDAVILAASLKAIPTEKRPNPVPGKDAVIEMEPLTPTGAEPFSFAVGRLFHDDLSVLPLLLARQQLLTDQPPALSRRALVVSNPGGGLTLLETFSRHTVKELRNCGYETTALFNEEVARAQVQSLLPSQDIFLWEGHYRTMVDRYEMPKWTEPLQPSLIFLQSCLALNEKEGQPLLRRGALAIVGSSTRTYSASGGSFTLAFFDALGYEHRALGGSLRHAKNFLLAYSLLKDKILGDKAKLSGANLRSAWAFTLWGDPTFKLPRPEAPEAALAPVSHKVHGSTLTVSLPETAHDEVVNKQYHAQMRPNARLAGLLRRGEEDDRHLVPFVFAEVHLPHVIPGMSPVLTSRVPAKYWVFCWDERRRTGYLLVVPRPKDEKEIRFHINWES